MFFVPRGTEVDRLTLWTVLAMLMTGSAVAFAAVPLGVLVFSAIVGGAAIASFAWTGDYVPAVMVVAYLAMIAIGTVQSARNFLTARVAESSAFEKSEVVSLLLREFEEGEADWLWQIDTSRRVRSVSPRFAFALGLDPEDIGGKPFLQLIAGESWETGQFHTSLHDLSERISYEEQLKALIADKELLAREIDHRVKNSLTIVGSLLSMQHKASESAETRAALAEAKSRVIAVARVHEQLHKSHQVGIVAFADYLRQLCHDLEFSLRRAGVELDFAADPVDLPAEQAMTLAIVVNELVTNAYKHGGAAGANKITVRLAQHGNELHLTVADDGTGLPATAVATSPGLGFRLIESLSKQLSAKLIMPKPGGPAQFGLILPYAPAATAAD